MKHLLTFAALLASGVANAQEIPTVASGTSDSGELRNWVPLGGSYEKSSVLKILMGAGWEPDVVSDQLQTDSYSMYTSSSVPGVVSFLAVPNDVGGIPLEFSPNIAGSNVVNASWPVISSDKIKAEILEGMQAAIDALCSMAARPTTIKAKASAMGVVEVEATWDAEKVCLSTD